MAAPDVSATCRSRCGDPQWPGDSEGPLTGDRDTLIDQDAGGPVPLPAAPGREDLRTAADHGSAATSTRGVRLDPREHQGFGGEQPDDRT
ncbi:hypothetical protein [Cryptosporangium sp. NPDC051539]|uniref:hypothetical protein n=1 Tax=Cryptosporangium sp. NPDC051539 TaxID=3363962 RepID=UPI0037A71721